VITDRPANMELESQQIQHGCLSSPSSRAHDAVGVNVETPDSEVAQVCGFLFYLFHVSKTHNFELLLFVSANMHITFNLYIMKKMCYSYQLYCV